MFAIGSDPELQADKHLRERLHRSDLTEYLGRISERLDLPDPAQTYKEILVVVRELLKAERASIMVFDEASNELVLKESEGLARGEGEVTKIKVGEGIAGEVFKSGKARVTDNLETGWIHPRACGTKLQDQVFPQFSNHHKTRSETRRAERRRQS